MAFSTFQNVALDRQVCMYCHSTCHSYCTCHFQLSLFNDKNNNFHFSNSKSQ